MIVWDHIRRYFQLWLRNGREEENYIFKTKEKQKDWFLRRGKHSENLFMGTSWRIFWVQFVAVRPDQDEAEVLEKKIPAQDSD